jgi:hypothetical protein
LGTEPSNRNTLKPPSAWVLLGLVLFLSYEVYDLRQEVKVASAHADDAWARATSCHEKVEELDVSCADKDDLESVKSDVDDLESKIGDLESRVSDLE